MFSLAPVGPAQAHEFWIEPLAWQLAPGDDLAAHLRVGQRFDGPASSFNPNRFRRFDLVVGAETSAAPGTIGDRPALSTPAKKGRLHVIVHVTTDSQLTYSEWEKFVTFVEHKDLDDTLAEHSRRGLPDSGFRERFSRYAKSLVAVGDGAGLDSEQGLLTELVAEANPYTDPLEDGLPVRLLYRGAPRVDAQVEVFERAPDGTVSITLERTDEEGRAIVPVRPGHDYMLDAVLMLPLDGNPDNQEPVWESLWANLTFAVPAR
ncbi:MAG: DUF4198 domain-containing protein [Pseudomonadota bacterium]